MTRILLTTLVGAVVLGALAAPALAWRCPLEWKAAEEAIKKAEGVNAPAEVKALLAEARRLVAESKKHHQEGNTKAEHAQSMWKARSALARAEAVIAVSQP
jgi:hypothetical protein